MNNPEDYKHIKAWNRDMGGFKAYTQEQQERAAKENAPINSTYRRGDGTWATVDDIDRPGRRDHLNSLAESYKE